MKYFWIFCLILLSLRSKSQDDTLRLYQIYSSFSDHEKAEWTSFENNWNYFNYTEIKQKLRVKKLSCKSCSSLFADLYVEINAEGKVTLVKFMNGKNCGEASDQKEFIELFEKSLKSQRFTVIKNKRFIARFGHGLKC